MCLSAISGTLSLCARYARAGKVIASATETEITTDIVSDLLPKEQFFRFNPRMHDMPIDEVRKERLDWLKTLADEYFEVRLWLCFARNCG